MFPYMNIKERIKRLVKGRPGKVKIGKQYVGPGEPVFVIAEIGINHNGDITIARKLIAAAKVAGADAVKFQKRFTGEILTKEGRNAPYDSPNAFAPTYGEHRDKLEFGEKEYRELKQFAEGEGILFFASVWDRKSVDFMDTIGVDAYKIPSADTTNLQLLDYVSRRGKPILISTGMSTEDEIDVAVSTVLKHTDKIILFHCLSLYPSPEEKINLRFMDVLKSRYSPLTVGYSGHEPDLLPTIAAVSRGAFIVERHFTLDKKMRGSDHAASLNPSELQELVAVIRRIEKILGAPERIMYDELKPLREKLAKSVATKVTIPAGAIITEDMLTVKGPGNGIAPSYMHTLIGRVAYTEIPEDSLVPKEALLWPRA